MAIVNYSEYLAHPEKVAEPTWEQLGVSSKGNITLPFNQIFIDDMTGNVNKVETHTETELEDLKLSFAAGIDTNEFPGAVVFRGDEYEQPYKLVYGFGRSEAQQNIGWESAVFTLLDGTPAALNDVQAAENEDYPKRLNREVDMRHHLAEKVRIGQIENRQEAIDDEFRRIYPRRHASVRNRVVKQVMDVSDTPEHFMLFPSKERIKQWVKNHSSEIIKIGGEWDETEKAVGVSMKEGYIGDRIIEAIARYARDGNPTYFVGYVGAPTKKANLSAKRNNYMKTYETHVDALKKLGVTYVPFRFRGFLPQDKANESIKTLITL